MAEVIATTVTTEQLLASLRPVDRVAEQIAQLTLLESSVAIVSGNVVE